MKDKITEESVFVCHSSACVFLAKYCIGNNLKIGQSVFVSGFNNYYFLKEFDDLNKPFYTDRLSEFKNLSGDRVCFYSKDDPYVKVEALQSFVREIDASKVFAYENAGHFNEKAGYTKFVDLFNILKK
jgi:predicted alpha/beta hydrolase family esterase